NQPSHSAKHFLTHPMSCGDNTNKMASATSLFSTSRRPRSSCEANLVRHLLLDSRSRAFFLVLILSPSHTTTLLRKTILCLIGAPQIVGHGRPLVIGYYQTNPIHSYNTNKAHLLNRL